MGAVDERQPLLGGQRQRPQAGSRQRLGAGHALSADGRLALTDQHEREMGQRREVTGGSDRAPARYDRHDIALEQLQNELNQLRTSAGMAAAQRGREQQQHPTHDLSLERRAGADGVRAEQVYLQPRGIGGRDPHRGELSEPGRDPVDRFPRCDRRFHHVTCCSHPPAVFAVERGRRRSVRHGLELDQRWHMRTVAGIHGAGPFRRARARRAACRASPRPRDKPTAP